MSLQDIFDKFKGPPKGLFQSKGRTGYVFAVMSDDHTKEPPRIAMIPTYNDYGIETNS